jgi:hypothetical protein
MNTLYLLTPVLVKELRMKSFGLFFVLPQICAAFVLLLQAFNDMGTTDLSGLSQSIFYGCLFLPLFFLLPARAFASISKDSEAGALELMSLTRMTTWHVAAGKWLALAALAFLFVSAMAPYALLQYFFSNANPIILLAQLFLSWIVSVIVSAFVLASAPLKHRGASWGFGLLLLVLGLPSAVAMILDRRGGSSVYSLLRDLTDFSVFCLVTALGVLLLLEVTASKLASPMDDFGPRKRLVAFVCCGISAFLVIGHIGIPELTVTCLALFSLPTVVTSMFEEASPVMTRHILQRGGGWRWLVSRGWPAGIFSSALILALALASAIHAGYFDSATFGPLYFGPARQTCHHRCSTLPRRERS